MAGRGGRRTGAGRKQIARSGPKQRQRTIARVKSWVHLVFDPDLRDSKGHLKALYMAGLDDVVKRVDNPRPVNKLRSDSEDLTDTEYAAQLDRKNEKIDERWWAIPAKDRPPLSEFLRRIK